MKRDLSVHMLPSFFKFDCLYKVVFCWVLIVGKTAVHVNIDSTDGVYEVFKAVEIDFDGMIDVLA